MMLGAILSGTIGLVIGSQGTSAGPLAIHLVAIADAKILLVVAGFSCLAAALPGG